MSRWDYGKGLPSVINGTAESEEQNYTLLFQLCTSAAAATFQ